MNINLIRWMVLLAEEKQFRAVVSPKVRVLRHPVPGMGYFPCIAHNICQQSLSVLPSKQPDRDPAHDQGHSLPQAPLHASSSGLPSMWPLG